MRAIRLRGLSCPHPLMGEQRINSKSDGVDAMAKGCRRTPTPMATSESGAFSRLPDIVLLIGIMLTGAKLGSRIGPGEMSPCPSSPAFHVE